MQHHNQPRTWHPQPHHPTTEEPSSFSFSRPIERAQRCLGMQRRCARHRTRGVHEAVGQKLKHDTSQRLSPTKLRCTIGPNTTQTKAGNGRNDCAEFTHAPTSTVSQKKSGNGHIDYAEFLHGGHQIPASKNVLKTLFSKGELGIKHCPLTCCVEQKALTKHR